MTNSGVSGELIYLAAWSSASCGSTRPPKAIGRLRSVADGEHDAAAEPVVVSAVELFAAQEAGPFQKGRRPLGAAGPLEQPVPAVGREAKVEPLGAVGGDLPLDEITATRLAIGRRHQAAVKLLLGPGQEAIESPFVAAGVARLAAGVEDGTGLLAEWDAGPLGEHFERFAKFQALGLHDEAEDVAAHVANPALERLPLGVDVQTGAAVVVPGAEGDVVAALAAELDIAAHELDDVDRLAHLLLQIHGRPKAHCGGPPVTNDMRPDVTWTDATGANRDSWRYFAAWGRFGGGAANRSGMQKSGAASSRWQDARAAFHRYVQLNLLLFALRVAAACDDRCGLRTDGCAGDHLHERFGSCAFGAVPF